MAFEEEKYINNMSDLEYRDGRDEEESLMQAELLRDVVQTRTSELVKISIIFGTVLVIILFFTIGLEGTFWGLLLTLSIAGAVFYANHSSDGNNSSKLPGVGAFLNFSDMNLEELDQQINHFLNKKEPITIWGMTRENEKLILKNEKVLLLKKLFDFLKSMGESLAEYKASIFLHSEYVQDYINNYRIKKKRQAEINEQIHLNKMIELKNVQRDLNLDYASREQDVLRKQYENERIKTESDVMKVRAYADAAFKDSKTIGQLETNSLIREFVNTIDLKQISPSMMTYIMRTLFSPRTEDYVDMEMHDMMRELIKKDKEAEIGKKEAEAEYRANEAKQKAAEARTMNYKAQGDKLKLDREKEKTRRRRNDEE